MKRLFRIKNLKYKKLVEESGLFDEDYYLQSNYDLRNKRISSLSHFLIQGGFDGRNPSNLFNSEYYLSQNKDVTESNINPLVHYILYGRKEGRESKPEIKIDNLFNTLNLIKSSEEMNSYKKNSGITATIVIPVYNSYDFVEANLKSVALNTDDKYKVTIVNDCSTDKRIAKLLTYYQDKKKFKIINNQMNIGFVKSINKAMKEVDTDIAILLNSDTVVPQNWVERMIEQYYGSNDIATTTPFSNSEIVYSFPKYGDNEMIFDLETMNESFKQIKEDKKLNECYSGYGFCMSINMRVWKEIGVFDEEAFERGFGEENDWCFRASLAGYKHMLVQDLFVYHKHCGSFDSNEKKNLNDKHQQILVRRYPLMMNQEISAFEKEDKWMKLRVLASLLLYKNKMNIVVDMRHPLRNELLNNKGTVLIEYDVEKFYWIVTIPSICKENYLAINDISNLCMIFDVFDVERIEVNGDLFRYMCGEKLRIAINKLVELKEPNIEYF